MAASFLSLSSSWRATRSAAFSSYVSPPGQSTKSDVTLGEVVALPLNAPLCPDEQRVCTHLVKRALQESTDQFTILRTGGQSLAFHHAPTSRVSLSEASDRTLKRRSDIMMDQRKSISGGSEGTQKQLQPEVRAMPKEEQQKLLSEMAEVLHGI